MTSAGELHAARQAEEAGRTALGRLHHLGLAAIRFGWGFDPAEADGLSEGYYAAHAEQ